MIRLDPECRLVIGVQAWPIAEILISRNFAIRSPSPHSIQRKIGKTWAHTLAMLRINHTRIPQQVPQFMGNGLESGDAGLQTSHR